jgi:hypothetical protein
VERREVDRCVLEAGRGEVLRVDRAEALVGAPVDPWQREPVRPDEHERVSLQQLEQSALGRRVRGLGARHAAARCVADTRAVRGRSRQEDELDRKPCRLAGGQIPAVDPMDLRVARERFVREIRFCVLRVVEQRKRARGHRRSSKLRGSREHDPVEREVAAGVALDRLADRRSHGVRP